MAGNNSPTLDPTNQGPIAGLEPTPATTPPATIPSAGVTMPQASAPDTGLLPPTPVTPAPDPVDPGTGVPEASTYEAERRDIDAGTDTVAGQMTSLLDEDSTYMQRARAQGMQQAAERGLLNTSIAVGASQAAAIDAALPIAQQDAETYLRQGLENQSAANTASSTNVQLESQAATAGASNQTSLLAQQMADQEAYRRTVFSEMETSRRQELISMIDLSTTNAKIAAEGVLKNMEIAEADRKTFSTAYNEMSRQNDVEIVKIATDPKLKPAEKQRLIDNQMARYEANAQLLADLYGIPIEIEFTEDQAPWEPEPEPEPGQYQPGNNDTGNYDDVGE